MSKEKVIVVGGGLAGLMTTMRAAEMGVSVDLFSIVPVKRSHSVCAQGGINGAVNTKGEGDSPEIHFDDTVYGGDFLADQPPVKAMCYAAPGIINLLDRMGVMFNRTPEGLLDFRRFGGTKFHRTAFAGATTGQQLLYALDEQVRRYEVEGLVQKYEMWEFLGLVKDADGICRGITALDWYSMRIETFPAMAVMIATGGPGVVFGRSTNSVINTGAAAGAAYQDGARYANGEFIQVHPTSIPGTDKLRLMSESARGEGGRMWVPKTQGDTRPPRSIPEGERWYFLEDKYPAYGNLVPRDIATREIFQICLTGLRRRPPEAGVPRPDAHPEEGARREARRDPGDLREVRRRRSARRPDEGLSRDALLDGRPLGGLRQRREDGNARRGLARNQATNVPGLYASARSTTSTTAPTGSAPTRSCRASTRERSAGRPWCATAARPRRSSRGRRRVRRGEEALGGRVQEDRRDEGRGERACHRGRDGRLDDRQRHRHPGERAARRDGGQAPGARGPVDADRPD